MKICNVGLSYETLLYYCECIYLLCFILVTNQILEILMIAQYKLLRKINKKQLKLGIIELIDMQIQKFNHNNNTAQKKNNYVKI